MGFFICFLRIGFEFRKPLLVLLHRVKRMRSVKYQDFYHSLGIDGYRNENKVFRPKEISLGLPFRLLFLRKSGFWNRDTFVDTDLLWPRLGNDVVSSDTVVARKQRLSVVSLSPRRRGRVRRYLILGGHVILSEKYFVLKVSLPQLTFSLKQTKLL